MIDNYDLRDAGLDLMMQNGKPLTKLPGHGRSMRYALPNGETVRIRTCNDHILIVVADDPDPDEATLNIEGTNWLLIVMPAVERTPGNVHAYFVPTSVAVTEVRRCQREWLASNPNTKGNNTTFNLWFDSHGKSSGYAEKWRQYRLEGQTEAKRPMSTENGAMGNIKDEVEIAKQRIAKVAGVSTAAVRITVDFGA